MALKMTLKEFFEKYNRLALGFSGGVDSSYLLWAALHYGAEVGTYYVSTAFQPEFEKRDALRLARSHSVVRGSGRQSKRQVLLLQTADFRSDQQPGSFRRIHGPAGRNECQ